MYQRFKDCLLKPRNIADYIKEPKKKTIIYTIVLLTLYIIPLILISLLSNSTVTALSSSVADDLIEVEQINYEIKESKLVSTKDVADVQIFPTEVIISQIYKINGLYVFDVTGEEYLNNLELEKGAYLVMLFTESEFRMLTIEVTDDADSETNNTGIAVNKELTKKIDSSKGAIKFNYADFDIVNVNFSGNKDNNSINFKNEIATFVTAIYKNVEIKLLPLIILFVILIGVGSYFSSVLLIALLFKLLYRYLQVDFGIVFKTIILCSTPYVITCLLASLTNFALLEIIGQVFMIGYATKALTTYKIKYDGGLPLPSYIQNMMDKKEDEEKGSDDDEL